MQSKVVCAFRMRLIRFGYTDIHISHIEDEFYYVYCISPSGLNIHTLVSISDMPSLPVHVFFPSIEFPVN